MTNIELVNKAIEVALGYKTVYASGMYGHKITNENISILQGIYPNWYNKYNRIDNLKALVGQGYFGFDCVCFVKALLWGWSGLLDDNKEDSDNNAYYSKGGAVYASNGVPDFSETAIHQWNPSSDFSNIKKGEFLYWLTPSGNTHCGIYIGDGLAVECTSNNKRCVLISSVWDISKNDNYYGHEWTLHAELPYVTYVDETAYTGIIQVDKSSYCTGENIKVTVSGIDSTYTEPWVGLYTNNITDYTNSIPISKSSISEGQTKYIATCEIDSDKNITYALPNGQYRIVLFKNKNYTVGASRLVTMQGAKICGARYAEGYVDVSINGHLINGFWIGIYPITQSVYNTQNPPVKRYNIPYSMRRVVSCNKNYFTTVRVPFVSENATAYKVVLFSDSGYTEASSYNIDVITMHPDNPIEKISDGSNTRTIVLNTTSFYQGGIISATYDGVTSKDAWIGLHAYNSAGNYSECTTGMWCYASTGQQWNINNEDNKIRHGKVTLIANTMDENTGTLRYLAPGTYKLILHDNNGTSDVITESSAFNIPTPEISAVSLSLTNGEYKFSYSNAPCYNSWIGLYLKSVSDYADVAPLAWARVPYYTAGTVRFTLNSLMPSQECKAVLFVNRDDDVSSGEKYRVAASCEFVIPYY